MDIYCKKHLYLISNGEEPLVQQTEIVFFSNIQHGKHNF